MHTALSTTTGSQNTEKEEIDEVALAATQQLLEFVELEARRFLDSTRSTMWELTVPRDIECILVRTKDGLRRFTFGSTRLLWFRPRDRQGYDLHRFYVKDLCDPEGHTFQVAFDRSAGSEAEKLRTVSVRRLGEPRAFPNQYGAGPRIK